MAFGKSEAFEVRNIASQRLETGVGDSTTACKVEMLESARRYNWPARDNIHFTIHPFDQNGEGLVVEAITVHENKTLQSVAFEKFPRKINVVPPTHLACSQVSKSGTAVDDFSQAAGIDVIAPGNIQAF
jgi:hypothetical protein